MSFVKSMIIDSLDLSDASIDCIDRYEQRMSIIDGDIDRKKNNDDMLRSFSSHCLS